MVSDLRDNTQFRLFEKFSRESLLITLVAICLIASTISWMRAERAIDTSTKAQILVESQNGRIDELNERVEYSTAHFMALRAELKANGYQLPPLEEK